MPTFGSLGAIIGGAVMIVCIIALLAVLGGVAFSVNPLIAVFVVGALLGLARIT